MRYSLLHALLTPLAATAVWMGIQDPTEKAPAAPKPDVTSRVETTEAGDLILIQEMTVNAPVQALWDAYTTSEGWIRWASPVAEIDLRAGGTILTHYTDGAKIGDEGTNTLHILNYVPRRVLTLQAELNDNWPEIMKGDAERLMNVLLFEELSPTQSKVTSYGLGYRETKEYEALLKFFTPANEGLMGTLKTLLEAK